MIRREVLNWLKEAQADLRRALRAFEEGDYALSVFMFQQACEKAFKAAYLAFTKSMYPRTHDLVVLYRGLRNYIELPQEIVELLPEVSQYYITARYPNAGLEVPSESISRTQATRALEVTKTVVTIVEQRIREIKDP